ncbi:MAG: hypothetical protein ABL308_06430 [Oceanicaulis sp.]
MSQEGTQSEPGPNTAHVSERWAQIREDVSAGLSIQYQVRSLNDFIEKLKSIDLTRLPEEEKRDIEEAIFAYEWGLEFDLPLAMRERDAVLEYCREHGRRIVAAGEDLLKFGVKTLMISHGAIIIAVIGSLSQGQNDSITPLLEKAIAFSLLGFALASIGLIRITHLFTNLGIQMTVFATGSKTNAEIEEFFEGLKRNRVMNFLTNDFLMYASLTVLFCEGVYTIWYLLFSGLAL